MYCLIIGTPLKKPRSVPLWNNFFKKKNMKVKMFEKDIKQKNFKTEILKIFKDPKFLAAAITMPYKKELTKYVKINDKLTKYAKSINFIIRKKNSFFGYNTDIFGASETVKNFKKKKIIIYGYGGAGEAILRTFYKTYKRSTFIVVSKKKISEFNKKRVKFVKKLEKDSLLSTDIFINCSPLGSNLKKNYLKKSPLTTDQFQNINKNILIFDLVYKPKRTKLFHQCKNFSIKYVNGLKMNSFQALKALMIILKFYRSYGKQ